MLRKAMSFVILSMFLPSAALAQDEVQPLRRTKSLQTTEATVDSGAKQNRTDPSVSRVKSAGQLTTTKTTTPPKELERKDAFRDQPKTLTRTTGTSKIQVTKVDPSRLGGLSRQDAEVKSVCALFEATTQPGTFDEVFAKPEAWRSFLAVAKTEFSAENTGYFVAARAFLKAPTASGFTRLLPYVPGGRTALNVNKEAEAKACASKLSTLLRAGTLKANAPAVLGFVSKLLNGALGNLSDTWARWSITCDACRFGFGSNACEASHAKEGNRCGQVIGGKGFTRVKPTVQKPTVQKRTTKTE